MRREPSTTHWSIPEVLGDRPVFAREISLTDTLFELGPGDTLSLYPDGASEVRRASSRTPIWFGEGDLALTLTACQDMDAREIIEHVGHVLAQNNQCWASDDTALLALRVPAPSARSDAAD